MSHPFDAQPADDAGALAELAAVTFPLACPPSSSAVDIAAHLATTLSEDLLPGLPRGPGHHHHGG